MRLRLTMDRNRSGKVVRVQIDPKRTFEVSLSRDAGLSASERPVLVFRVLTHRCGRALADLQRRFDALGASHRAQVEAYESAVAAYESGREARALDGDGAEAVSAGGAALAMPTLPAFDQVAEEEAGLWEEAMSFACERLVDWRHQVRADTGSALAFDASALDVVLEDGDLGEVIQQLRVSCRLRRVEKKTLPLESPSA